jgi:hypothetical protein
MEISVSLAKWFGSVTEYSAPKSLGTYRWDFRQSQHLNWAGCSRGYAMIAGFSSSVCRYAASSARA